jgi:hypothetical protein
LIAALGWGTQDERRRVADRLLLRAEADLPHGRNSLYMCPECAVLGCGAVSAIIERIDDKVIWRDFGYENTWQEGLDTQHLESLRSYTFEWEAYVRAIHTGASIDDTR